MLMDCKLLEQSASKLIAGYKRDRIAFGFDKKD